MTDYVTEWIQRVTDELMPYLKADEHVCPSTVMDWLDELIAAEHPPLIVVGGIRIPDEAPNIKAAMDLLGVTTYGMR